MRLSVLKLLLILAVPLAATGCVTRAPFVHDPSLTQNNSADITIYRPDSLFHSLNPEKPFLYVDEKEVGNLGVGEALFIKLPPGEHRFSIREPILFQPSYESESLSVVVKAGETYYLRYSKEMSGALPSAGGPVVTSSTGFDIVPPSIGEARQARQTGSNRSVFDAAFSGNTEAVEALLRSGGDPNELGGGGWTPLMIAAAEGHSRTVHTLIKAGANVNAKSKEDRTALMFATRYGFESIVTALIEAGANVNLMDQEGNGALWAAVREGHVSLVKLLLQKGANPSTKDRTGKTTLDWAKKAGNQEIVELVEQAVAGNK